MLEYISDLVVEILAVNALSTFACTSRVPALNDEFFDIAVKLSFVVVSAGGLGGCSAL